MLFIISNIEAMSNIQMGLNLFNCIWAKSPCFHKMNTKISTHESLDKTGKPIGPFIDKR